MLAVVTGGGTGGHVIPAMAIMSRFKDAGWDVLYVGSLHGIETKIIGGGVKKILLNVRGVKGKGVIKGLHGAILIILSFFKVFFSLLKERPAVVVGTGGFVCIPAVAASYLSGAAVYLQEQNAVPGAAVKFLSRFAKKIFLGFEDAAEYLPAGKTVYSGNPLRKEFLPGKREYKIFGRYEKMCILILGGSQGAGFINRLFKETLSYLDKDRFFIFHQTGEKDKAGMEKAYREKEMNAEVFAYSGEVHRYYLKAHLIISRSGAMSVSEITATLRPSVLIPFPHAVYDHQAKNAAALADKGAAYMFRENEISPEKLAGLLNGLYERPERLSETAKNLEALKFKDSAEFITGSIMEDMRV